MSENLSASHLGKSTATAIAAALMLTGCTTPEQTTARDTVNQAYTDVVAGKPVAAKIFGDKTFTISLRDVMRDGKTGGKDFGLEWAADQSLDEGEQKIAAALGIERYERAGGIMARAVCVSAEVSGLITPKQLETIQSQTKLYEKSGGEKALDEQDVAPEALAANKAIQNTCERIVHDGLVQYKDITFVPASHV